MKRNPFYVLSATAMLAGCYLLSHALKLQPGQLGKLLVLIVVLQVYEALLIALGAYLVATGRAPRDGVTVLVLESIFLLDATFLAMECVTSHLWAGTAVSFALLGLAAGKLALVRRFVPELLPERAARVLAAHAALVLMFPVTAAHLVTARLMGPSALYVLWWTALALAPAQKWLQDRPGSEREYGRVRTWWSWCPAASVLAHLLALGIVYGVSLQPAFVAPFLLGLALCTRREQVVAQIVLPFLAVVFSLGQLELGLPLGWDVTMSPMRLALFTAALTYVVLARRFRHPWLMALACVFGLSGALGGTLSGISDTVARLVWYVFQLVPKSALEWGIGAVIAAFAFLAGGARRSLQGTLNPPGSGSATDSPRRGGITLSLLLAVLASLLLLSSLEGVSPDGADKPFITPHATGLALIGAVLGLCALRRSRREVRDPEGRRVGRLAVALSAVCLVLGSVLINDHEFHDYEPLGTAVSDTLPLDSWRQP